MSPNVAAQVKELESRITDSPDIESQDRVVLDRFADRLKPKVPQQIGHMRQRKLLRSMILLAERHGGVADALESRDAAESLKQYIDEAYQNEESNRDMRAILRQFGKALADGDEPPDSLEWIPTTYSNNYDTTPDPRDILTWDDDVAPMIQAAMNERDRAMVALAFDSGLRSGEFKSLECRDFQNHDHGLKVTVEGKQGRRSVLLVPSVPYVTEWLSEHPGNDPNDQLWSHLGRPKPVSDALILKQLKDVAERAGVGKPVTPTNFRKSSAAYLARRNVNQAHIEDHHGWVRGSDAAARYIQVFGCDTDREIARAHGKDVSEEEPDPVKPARCPRCDATVEPHRDFCGECSHAIDREAHAVVERALDKLDEKLVVADDQETRQYIIDARRDIQDNPGGTDIDKLHEMVSSLDSSA